MATRSERAEAVRKLVREARHGLLSTTGLEPAGIPYGSLVPVASNEEGLPVVLREVPCDAKSQVAKE